MRAKILGAHASCTQKRFQREFNSLRGEMVEGLRLAAGDLVGLAQRLCRFQVIVAVAPHCQGSSASRLDIVGHLLHGSPPMGRECRRLETTWVREAAVLTILGSNARAEVPESFWR